MTTAARAFSLLCLIVSSDRLITKYLDLKQTANLLLLLQPPSAPAALPPEPQLPGRSPPARKHIRLTASEVHSHKHSWAAIQDVLFFTHMPATLRNGWRSSLPAFAQVLHKRLLVCSRQLT